MRKRELQLYNLEWTMEVAMVEAVLKVKHGSDAAEVSDVHEAGAGEVGNVVEEREMRMKSNS